jgi:hypothetical protein
MMNLKPAQIVSWLLGKANWVERLLGEASVHRPHRSRIYVAAYTGPSGGQCWKTTGTDDLAAAMVIARELEAAARAQRAQSGGARQPQRRRLRPSPGSAGGGLTQREVARLLHISERGVHAIERRALLKLAQHPQLREIWRQYLAGELTEQAQRLSVPEIQALLGLTRSRAERETLRKVFAMIRN